MEVLLENIIAYFLIFFLFLVIFVLYYFKHARRNKAVKTKIEKAKFLGFHEPVSLHPVVDLGMCIGSGACVAACPEKDILGIVHGRAETINASRCIGHGACFHACPVGAISLCIGTEKRGVDIPQVSPEFETNVPGIFIAGELGGMGLVKNAVEQGRQAVECILGKIKRTSSADYDLVIIGAGPAGISASLAAKQNNLRFITLEQDTIGGTVYNFPRSKIVMTSPMNLPMYGKVKLNETSKSVLVDLWNKVLSENNIQIKEQEKVENVLREKDYFLVTTSKGSYKSNTVLLAIGRRGSPAKLNIPGEQKEKVYYRLLEPEAIHNNKILVVGGGDSAIESALMLSDEGNDITVSYRSDKFTRLKPKNLERISNAVEKGKVSVVFNSTVLEIKDDVVILNVADSDKLIEIPNDIVYIFAGGELPTKFIEKIGIAISKKHGDALLKK